MVSPWLHRTAILLAASTLLFLTFGGSLLGHGAHPEPDWGLDRVFLPVVGVLTVAAFVLLRSAGIPRLRTLGTLLLVGLAIEIAVAVVSTNATLPVAVTIANACVVYLFFAGTMVLMKTTSARWLAGPEYVEDSGTPSMRSLGVALPIVTLVQVAMGAAYRQQALPIMPHMVGAMVIGLVLLTVPLFVLAQYSKQKALRGAAINMLGITAVQILLGIAAYIARVVFENPAAAPAWAIAFPLLHVATGAMTFAAAVVLAVQILRNVQPKAAASHQPLAVSE